MSRLPEGDEANAELLAYLILGAAAQKAGESLLRPKVHFFLRGLDEMVVALDGTDADPRLHLFLSIHDAKEHYPGRQDDAFFPVLTCRSCGQHFFEKYCLDLEFARGAKKQLRGFENGKAAPNEDGQENAFWSTSPEGTGTRMVLTIGSWRRRTEDHPHERHAIRGLGSAASAGQCIGNPRLAAWRTAVGTKSRFCR